MGADRQLVSAEGIEQYFELVASQSDRVRVVDLGSSTEGHRTLAAIVSAPENIRISSRFAPPTSDWPIRARCLRTKQNAWLRPRKRLWRSGRASTHRKSERRSGKRAALHARLVDRRRHADYSQDVVGSSSRCSIPTVIGSSPIGTPGIRARRSKADRCHGCITSSGHDINRDAFMMNLAENRNLAKFLYSSWHPQVFSRCIK